MSASKHTVYGRSERSSAKLSPSVSYRDLEDVLPGIGPTPAALYESLDDAMPGPTPSDDYGTAAARPVLGTGTALTQDATIIAGPRIPFRSFGKCRESRCPSGLHIASGLITGETGFKVRTLIAMKCSRRIMARAADDAAVPIICLSTLCGSKALPATRSRQKRPGELPTCESLANRRGGARGHHTLSPQAGKKALENAGKELVERCYQSVMKRWATRISGGGQLTLEVEGMSLADAIKLKTKLKAIDPDKIRNVDYSMTKGIARFRIKAKMTAETLAEYLVEDQFAALIEIVDLKTNRIQAKRSETECALGQTGRPAMRSGSTTRSPVKDRSLWWTIGCFV